MKKRVPDGDTVDDYIARFSLPVQKVLQRVRKAIRKAIPGAEEGISYKMPVYRLNGRYVLYFAAWSRHYSLYPSTAALAAAFKDELARYEVSKGTIRFPLSEPVPVRLIEQIAKFRAKEAAESERSRSSRG